MAQDGKMAGGNQWEVINEMAANRVATNGWQPMGGNQRVATNGVATNGVATNGVATNGVATNGVATNGVATNSVTANGWRMAILKIQTTYNFKRGYRKWYRHQLCGSQMMWMGTPAAVAVAHAPVKSPVAPAH